MNMYHHTFQKTREKYLKFKYRLERSISSGSFDKLSRKKKNTLIARVEKFRSQLEGFAKLKNGAVLAGSIGAVMLPNALAAQDPLMRFERGTKDIAVFGTNVHIEVANIDSDPELETLISTTSDGFIIEGNDKNGYEVLRPSSLDLMREEFWVGDVDNDGDNDIVFRSNDYFYLLFNDGDGNFELTEQVFSYSASSTAGAIARETNPDDIDLVDFDSDGDLDLVIAYADNSLKHFDNDGSGAFSGVNYLYVNRYDGVTEFEFADMDADGDLDLIHNQSDGADNTRVYVKENTADADAVPVFSGANTYLLQYEYASFQHISALDMDGDKDLDLFFSDGSYNQNFVYQNRYDEGQNFQFNSISNAGLPNEAVNDVEINDFDGDGNDDLLIAFNSESKIAVFDGADLTASDHSLNGEIGDAARAFSSVAVGDIDADGLDDIIGLTTSLDPFVYFDKSAPYISSFNGEVIIDENKPAGVIANLVVEDFHSDPITSYLSGDDASNFTWNETTGDLSTNQPFDWEESGSSLDLSFNFGDGNKSRTEKINIKINNLPEEGNGLFDSNSYTLESSSGVIEGFKSSDIDQDGDADLFVTDETILINNGITFVKDQINVFSDGATEVAFIDFDDDGDLDLFGLDNSGLYAVENSGDGGWNSIGTNFIGSGSFDFIPGDFDSDGLEEVALIRRSYSSSQYTYFRRFEVAENNSSFSQEQNISLQPSAGGGAMQNAGRIVDIDIADFDNDGNVDLLIIAENDGVDPGTDAFFNGTGSGFSDTSTAATGFNADNGFNRIEIGDLNLNGSIDIATLRYDGTEVDIDIMINDESGGFSVSQSLDLGGVIDTDGEQLADLKLGDMDGDGSLDIVVAITDMNGQNDITLWLNDASGTFTLKQTLSNVSGVELELMDVDNDDDLDIVLREENSSSNDAVKVFLNTNVSASSIGLSSSTLDEHLPEDTQVASVSVTDDNPNDAHIISLADGDGTNDEHNNFFAINGNNLILTRDVSAEEFPTLNILLAANDGENIHEQAFTLTVSQVNLAPTAIALSSDNFNERTAIGTSIGTITATDDGIEALSFELATGDGTNDADNGSFRVEGDQLIIDENSQFESKPSYNVYISAADVDGSTEQAFVINVNDVNQAPSAIALSADNIDEGSAIGSTVGTITATDDSIEPLTFELVDGDGTNDADNESFRIEGDQLKIDVESRFETKESFNIYVRASDIDGNTEQAFVISVNDVNQAPTAIALSATSLDESVFPGNAIADISATDPNTTDTHTFSLVDGTGSDDNDKFIIQGNQLILIKTLEFNTTPSLSIRIVASDGEESFEQSFALTVNEVLGLEDEIRNVLGIYPNPGQDKINFNIENDLYGEMNVKVVDLAGRSVHQFDVQKNTRNWTYDLDMSTQKSGIYVIEVIVGRVKLAQRWIKKD
ncbi:MAG: FG-GAP-like repeat-containing protein [Ekhidna sp.]